MCLRTGVSWDTLQGLEPAEIEALVDAHNQIVADENERRRNRNRKG